jgi:peptidoglycan/LPS O-acetylase OafA/YrhL
VIIPGLDRIGDLSYGTYLYAYPVSNLAVVWLIPRCGWMPTMIVAAVAVTGMALLSWHFVERPALLMKAKVRAVPAPRTRLSESDVAEGSGWP